MDKKFHTFIKKYQFHPFERIFDEDIQDVIKTTFTEKESTIYAIVETDKISFLPETFKSIGNYSIQGSMTIGGKLEHVVFNIAKTWYDSDSQMSRKLQEKFKTYENFLNFHMSQYQDYKNPKLSNAEKYHSLVEVDLEKSDTNSLFVKCPIASAGNGGLPAYAQLFTFQTLNFFSAECISDLDILYIGKSTSNTFERLKNHEKWGPIMAGMSSEKNYLVYFFEIENNLFFEEKLGGLNVRLQAENNLPKDAITKLCEASLINYYKPRFNKEHTASLIGDSEIVKKWLKKNDYTELITEVELDGLMGRLCTKSQPYKRRHAINIMLSPITSRTD